MPKIGKTLVVKGVQFTYGKDNDFIYYETVQGNNIYCLLQHRDASWWTVIVQQVEGTKIRPLNCALKDWDGNIVRKDPLYVHCPVSSEPSINTWMEKVAEYINQGNDPWAD
jgi:hypothetical protein